MTISRIPQVNGVSKKAAFEWLSALHEREMLFCLDDDPREILKISDWTRAFTEAEAEEISEILNRLFAAIGDELHDLAFQVMSNTFHTAAERSAFQTQHG
jgi:hypothetical protein